MPPPAKTKTPKDIASSESSASPEAALSRYLDQTKTEHFNYIPDTNYVVSSGSLSLDVELHGFAPGLVRLCGNASAGKSSFALNVARQFVETVPHSRILFIKAEARLSDEIQSRCGLPFTKDPKAWQDGSVFVFECNVYEVVIGLLRTLVTDNPTNCRYMIILDSMDGLNLRDDASKAIDQANKVAGAPLLTTQFLQKMSVAMTKYGHLCFFLSQVRNEIKLDPYAKASLRQVASAGGAAIQHYASHVLFFQEWYEGDLILEKEGERLNRLTNKALGHICKIKIIKTDKEKRYTVVEIPIKHNQTGGGSIWREREIGDVLLMWQLVTKTNPKAEKKDGEPKKGGAWLYFAPTLLDELDKEGLPPLPADKEGCVKVQGLNQLYDLLEARKDLTDYLFKRFRDMLSAPKA